MRGYHIRIVVKNSTSQDTFIPKSLFQALPSHSSRTSGKDPRDKSKNKDYRFGPITLDWVEYDAMNKSGKDKELRQGTVVVLVTRNAI